MNREFFSIAGTRPPVKLLAAGAGAPLVPFLI
jgi:hypothetical protein